MEDLVKIVNRKGIVYEVTRVRAEMMVTNRDITHRDIYELDEVIDPKKVKEDLHTIPVKSVPVVAPVALKVEATPAVALNIEVTPLTEATVVELPKVGSEITEIQVLRAEYKAKFKKGVPVNKVNDAEWIKEKLSSK